MKDSPNWVPIFHWIRADYSFVPFASWKLMVEKLSDDCFLMKNY